MGTNYYLRKNICMQCNRYDEQHIGKASFGWRFCFNPYRESYKEWKLLLSQTNQIYNEYGEKIEFDYFCNMVESKQDGKYDTEYEYTDAEGYRVSRHDDFS